MKQARHFLLCVLIFPMGARTQSAPVDSAMEARISRAWEQVVGFYNQLRLGKVTVADDPQAAYAEEFFHYYREHRVTPTGIKACAEAFKMWGNVGADDKMEEALLLIPTESEIWSAILLPITKAYNRKARSDDFHTLLLRLEDQLTHPKSQSELFFRLASYYRRTEQINKAKTYFERVISLGAQPYNIQLAQSALHEMTSLKVGQVAPDFTATTIEGTSIKLSDFRGRVVLLEFWASWCGPCLPEIPRLRALNDNLPPADFKIIGISEDEDPRALRQFLQQKKMAWPQVLQPFKWEGEESRMGAVASLYNVFTLPRSFLVDRKGIIAAKDLRGDELEKFVRQLINARE